MIRAGDLDRTILIERASNVPNEYGEPIDTWSPLATVRAKVTETPGREFIAGTLPVAERRAVFLIRFRGDVTNRDRVTYNGRAFDIVGTREIGRRAGLELHGELVE